MPKNLAIPIQNLAINDADKTPINKLDEPCNNYIYMHINLDSLKILNYLL